MKGTVTVQFRPPYQADGTPGLVLSLHDGNVRWVAEDYYEPTFKPLQILAEFIGAAIPEWESRITRARGHRYWKRLARGKSPQAETFRLPAPEQPEPTGPLAA